MSDRNHHLDDEQLSALIDGEVAEPAPLHEHLDACDVCAARTAHLRAVAARVAEPPPPMVGGDPEAAITAALAVWDAGRPIALHPARPRRLPPPAWVGVAAAVLIVLALAPMLLRSRATDDV